MDDSTFGRLFRQNIDIDAILALTSGFEAVSTSLRGVIRVVF